VGKFDSKIKNTAVWTDCSFDWRCHLVCWSGVGI